MRRVMLLALSVLMVVSMSVSPALANDWDGDGCDEERWSCDRWNRHDGNRHDGNRHDRNRHDRNRHANDAEVCFVFVFVPLGFWDFDFWNWVWFWQDLGSHWECSD
jgi:hypothetical protein